MSSTIRENGRGIGEASCNGIVRRMVGLPRSILGGFSRVMGHGINVMGSIGGRRHHPQPLNFQFPQLIPQEPVVVPEEFAFLNSFEQQYGSTHPFFYACNFMEALKIAEDEHKFMFMYLHSPQHPFTTPFCRDTLCSEFVTQFLDANFISWGALADRGEGLQMAATMRAASFPFCAVVAPAAGNSIAVLQQMEGPISPAELVEILQRTMEEQGSAFGGARAKEEEKARAIARAKEEEKIKADRQLREEQDAAYLAALKIDKEKEKLKQLPSGGKAQNPVEVGSNKANYEKFSHTPIQKHNGKAKITPSTIRETQYKQTTNWGKDSQVTQILIRFPSGERREHSFSPTDRIQSIYRYVDSLGLPGVENYKLVSSFPRRVYGVDQMGITLKEAGLHPRASLFLELQ
ncbi:plant UBX domain-containing protein 10-like [Pistacia vera]|uniref:plant UBX domain-containing protein 10-like n=1 Tax=Pistacia vera TaxID=55513 RepID=UPI001262FCD0|nr:plant UBX domain-containing protein 10-like [Pistacia vera]